MRLVCWIIIYVVMYDMTRLRHLAVQVNCSFASRHLHVWTAHLRPLPMMDFWSQTRAFSSCRRQACVARSTLFISFFACHHARHALPGFACCEYMWRVHQAGRLSTHPTANYMGTTKRVACLLFNIVISDCPFVSV